MASPPAARSQIDETRFRDSLEEIQGRIRRNPGDARLHVELGQLYVQWGEGMKAIGAFRLALQLDEAREDAVLALSSLFFQCGHDDQAADLLARFLKASPDSAGTVRLLCRIRIRQSDYEDALPLARRLVQLEPDAAYGHYLLGLTLDGLGQPSKATDSLETALQFAPDFADAHLQLGLLYSRDSNTFLRAHRNLQRAVDLGLNHPQVRSQLGLVLLKLGRPREAIEELKRALQQDPELAEAYYLLADAYRTLGMVSEASDALQRFQSLRATSGNDRGADSDSQVTAEKLYQQGMDSLFEHRPDDAYATLLEVLEIDPRMHLARYRLAQIDFLRGDVRQAEDRIRAAIQAYGLDPEYYFLLAKCLEASDPSASLRAIDRAIDLDPRIADFHNMRANLLFSKSDYEAAIEAYRQAIALDARDPVPHLNLAAALRMVGATREAEAEKEIYRRLISEGEPE